MSISNTVCVISASPKEVEAIQSAIDLREVEAIQPLTFEGALGYIQQSPPALVIIDAEGKMLETQALLKKMPKSLKKIVLSERYDEEFFLSCFDAGNTDFLLKPVPKTYLISRVLAAFEMLHLEAQIEQRDSILKDFQAVSLRSGVFTTQALTRLLQKEAEQLFLYPERPLSMVMLALGGIPRPLSSEAEQSLYHCIAETHKDCGRGSDIVGEYFEDKFVVLLPKTPLRGAQSLARRIAQKLANLEVIDRGKSTPLAVYTGVADYSNCRHYEDLLHHALKSASAVKPF